MEKGKITVENFDRGEYGMEPIIYEGETREEAIERGRKMMQEILERNANREFNNKSNKEVESPHEVKTINFTNEGEIKSSKVKVAVYSRIDFDLPEDLWDKIDDLFAECWNDVIGLRGAIYENQIEQYIYNGLKKEKIIFPYDKVSKIVGIIFDYIKMTGGFLKEDE